MEINIKDRMERLGLNRSQVAKEVKITYPAICNIYDSKTTAIEFKTLENLCRVLECTPNDILICKNK